MDILNILNDYIKNNKSNELVDEIVTLLNDGEPLYKIVRKYEYTSEQIENMITSAGYIFSQKHQKWVIPNTDPQSNEVEHSDKVFEKTESKLQQPDNIEVKQQSIKTADNNDNNLDLEKVASLLNEGARLEILCKQYNITSQKLHNLLLKNGYTHYLFMNYWTKLSKSELCDFLVEQLNQGVSVYDLSIQYVKGRRDRVNFVSKAEQMLKLFEYSYISTSKQWTKNDIQKDKLSLIVNQLNNDIAMKTVAESFNTTASNIRIELRNNRYRYDSLYKIWTKSNRKELLEMFSVYLDEGKVTFEELEAKGLNIELIKAELSSFSISYKENNKIAPVPEYPSLPIENINVQENSPETLVLESQIIDKDNTEQNNNDLSINNESFINLFNEEDISNLKELIDYWKEKKLNTASNNTKSELSIFLEPEILSKLTLTSEMEGISRSLIIEKALKDYLKF